ncbi:KMT2E [Bugula neritina]|uniref:KMT2E n=1 Tax=Bugula neritina TaxID=10212 RepID=A0A7J7IY86_BUGNE|nr:KMT2E [Bugula neritina]
MICCDQCQVWQHIDCMGIDRTKIPDEYSCEQCMPRKVYRARARLIQKKKRTEILRNTNEDENAKTQEPPTRRLKPNSKNLKTKFSQDQENRKAQLSSRNRAKAALSNKKKAINTLTNSALRTKKKSKRSEDSGLLSVDGETEESPWTVPYDQADSNQYSADIQESLKAYRTKANHQLASVLSELDEPRCQLRLLNNGRRGLEVNADTPPNQALIEFKGKVMLHQQFQQKNNYYKRPQPFTLFYGKWDGLDICVDATSLGTEARFVQRSCSPNAEVRHIIENGQVHLVIFSTKEISGGSEVTIPFDYEYKRCEYCVECACSKVQCPVKKSSRKYKKNVTLESGSNGHVQTPQSSRKAVTTENKQSLDSKLKVQIPAPINGVHETKNKKECVAKSVCNTLTSPSPEKSVEESRRLSREDRKIKAYMEAFEKMAKREEDGRRRYRESVRRKSR